MRLPTRARGQNVVEYGALIATIVLVVLLGVGAFGRQLEPWFAALTAPPSGEDRVRRFMQEGSELDGVPVRVSEMLGEPGDVILMHPLLMHAPTPNVLQTPRMMLTQFVYSRT